MKTGEVGSLAARLPLPPGTFPTLWNADDRFRQSYLTDYPGYYKTGGYGIRIENLVLVVDKPVEGAEKETLGFETLTFAPIERRLIDVSMLSDRELNWVNDYHAEVLAKIGPRLEGEDKAWLERQCAPLSR